jgi:hypothetical protein
MIPPVLLPRTVMEEKGKEEAAVDMVKKSPVWIVVALMLISADEQLTESTSLRDRDEEIATDPLPSTKFATQLALALVHTFTTGASFTGTTFTRTFNIEVTSCAPSATL